MAVAAGSHSGSSTAYYDSHSNSPAPAAPFQWGVTWDAMPPLVPASPLPTQARGTPGGSTSTAGAGISPHLGDLPHDLLLEIIKHMAPAIPDVVPCTQEDMEMPPAELYSRHEAMMQEIAAAMAAEDAQAAAQAAGGGAAAAAAAADAAGLPPPLV